MFNQEEKFLLNQYLLNNKLTQKELINEILKTHLEDDKLKDVVITLIKKIKNLNAVDYINLCLSIPMDLDFDIEIDDFFEIDII